MESRLRKYILFTAGILLGAFLFAPLALSAASSITGPNLIHLTGTSIVPNSTAWKFGGGSTNGTFNQASTTLLSVTNQAYFGGTATSTFAPNGSLTLATPLAVLSGGTGNTTGLQFGVLYSSGGTSTVAAAGSSYAAGDTITLSSGTCSTNPVLAVLSITGSAVNDFVVRTPGICTTIPSNPVAQGFTSGSGSGATFNLSWGPVASQLPGNVLHNGVGSGNFSIGGSSDGNFGTELAGQNITTGIEDAFVGDKAGLCVTSGTSDTALGHNAMGNGVDSLVAGGVTGGCLYPVQSGSDTAIGQDALRNIATSTTNGGGNTVVGASAMHGTSGIGITSNNDVAIGTSALNLVTSSSNNTCVGTATCRLATSSLSGVTALGYDVGFNNLGNGGGNQIEDLLLGFDSSVDTATINTSFAIGGGEGPKPGNYDVIFGWGAGQNNLTDGNANVWIGKSAGSTATSTNNSVGIGNGAVSAANYKGNQQTGVGAFACQNATGNASTCFGFQSGVNISTGQGNTFIGEQSGQNSANSLTGNFNNGLGAGSLGNVQGSAGDNVGIGLNAGNKLTSGNSDTFIGDSVGSKVITTGSRDILIGENNGIDTPANNTNNFLDIGNLLFGTNLTQNATLGGANLGIASSSPYATLSIHANNGDTNQTLFAIGSSTASATTTLLSVLNTGATGHGTSTPAWGLSVDVVTGTQSTSTIGNGSATHPSCLQLFAPNGTAYRVFVSNAGALTTVVGSCN